MDKAVESRAEQSRVGWESKGSAERGWGKQPYEGIEEKTGIAMRTDIAGLYPFATLFSWEQVRKRRIDLGTEPRRLQKK